MSTPLRLGFAGTPAFAATILERLLEAGFPVHLVLTQPDRPTGRGRKLQASPVKVLAQTHGIPLRQPERLKAESLTADALDALIVAAYGLLLPAHILTTPRLGCINVHASLLPRWRGAAPVERAIMAGDQETGVCIMKMDEGLDTGPVYRSSAIPIDPHIGGADLEARLARLGADLLVDVLPLLETLEPTPQPEAGANYARKLRPADSRINWQRSAAELERQIRALQDRAPVTVFAVKSGAAADPSAVLRVRLLAAEVVAHPPGVGSEVTDTATSEAPQRMDPGTLVRCDKDGIEVRCGNDILRITRVQLNRGKGKPLDARSILNGFSEYFTPAANLLAEDPTTGSGHGRG